MQPPCHNTWPRCFYNFTFNIFEANCALPQFASEHGTSTALHCEMNSESVNLIDSHFKIFFQLKSKTNSNYHTLYCHDHIHTECTFQVVSNFSLYLAGSLVLIIFQNKKTCRQIERLCLCFFHSWKCTGKLISKSPPQTLRM